MSAEGAQAGVAARRAAIDALVRIEDGDAYANLALPPMLDRSDLPARDRRFVTELVYGTTRMRRACDWLVDRHLERPVETRVRAGLRLGAYQLAFLDTPPHAAVDATVGATPSRARGLVNAVLRRVGEAAPEWPDDATRLSYPDWIVDRLVGDLGRPCALDALDAMNRPPPVQTRDDGYQQGLASQWVARLAEVEPGHRVADLCAAPGGKATALGHAGASVVVGADVRPARARLVADNASALGLGTVVRAVVADGRHPPMRAASFDRVLVDAPCSGLGALHRRPDARWRVQPADVDRLVELQSAIVGAAVPLVRPGGVLVYSVCTLTAAETTGVDEHLAAVAPAMEALPPPSAPWRPWGRGALLLPQDAATDGMAVLRLRRPDRR